MTLLGSKFIIHLVHNDEPNRVHAAMFYQAVDERACLLDGGNVQSIPLASLAGRNLTSTSCVFLNSKIQLSSKRSNGSDLRKSTDGLTEHQYKPCMLSCIES